ncbi:hypothetical protein HS096_02745 [candidate division WWE3 bacterium]|uniref:Uncharacterized protein n=1 Tax=candidate division WWE3 bacterium TaxID=2053526 RepID=A0A928Y4W7_UNCKA|nr:hypothetical protein [candidate division WWE3 bacterium]
MNCLHDIRFERHGKHLLLSRDTREENRERILWQEMVPHGHALFYVPLLCDICLRNIPLNASPRRIFERRENFSYQRNSLQCSKNIHMSPDMSVTTNTFTAMLMALERRHVAEHHGHHTANKHATAPIRALIPVVKN